MKQIILVILLFMALMFNTKAQAKQEKIRELFLLMQTDKLMVSMVDNMSALYQNKASFNGNAKKDSVFRAFVKEETIAMSKRMFEKDMVDIYDKYFTTAEIQNYIDFYKSPEGKKLLEVIPAIQKEIMTNMITHEMPLLQEKFKKKTEELQN